MRFWLVFPALFCLLAACTREEESVANRYERQEAEIENKERSITAKVENEVRAAEAALENQGVVQNLSAPPADANEAATANSSR